MKTRLAMSLIDVASPVRPNSRNAVPSESSRTRRSRSALTGLRSLKASRMMDRFSNLGISNYPILTASLGNGRKKCLAIKLQSSSCPQHALRLQHAHLCEIFQRPENQDKTSIYSLRNLKLTRKKSIC